MTDKQRAVQRMQDYIEEHIFERITPGQLAEVAYFSPFYSARIFRDETGFSPADYIRRLRLSKSASKLRDGNLKIIDIAYESGYDSVDGYQRAFLREFGINPSEYVHNPSPLPLFTPYKVKFDNMRKVNGKMENVKSVFIQVIDKPARKVLIKRGEKATEYFEYCNEVGCDLWETLVSMESLCGEPVCLWLPEEYRKPSTSEYVQGVEKAIDFDGEIPEGFDVITLPASKYLMFQGEPFNEEDYQEAIGALMTSIDRYDPAFIGYAWDESNPRIQLAPIGERGYIELRAIKAK